MILTKISNFFRANTKIAGALLGIRPGDKGRTDYREVITAGWIYIIGLPIGTLIFGELFSPLVWLFIITLILIAMNLDAAMMMLNQILDHGLDGEVI